MSIIQTSRIHNVDVGTPPSSLSTVNNEWEIIKVRYHGFENLSTTRNEYFPSPEFTCFGGHQWRLEIYPGGDLNSNDGMVSIFLQNMSDESIKVKYGFTVKDKEGNTQEEWVSPNEGRVFAPRGTSDPDNQVGASWGSNNFCKRTQIIDALVDGTLIVEVRMRKFGETAPALPFIPENPLVKNILSMFMDEESADIFYSRWKRR